MEHQTELDQWLSEGEKLYEQQRAAQQAADPEFYARMRVRMRKARERLNLNNADFRPPTARIPRIAWPGGAYAFWPTRTFVRLSLGVLHNRPAMDILHVRDAGLLHQPDPVILRHAREQGRLVLRLDKRTMPGHLDILLLTL